MELECFKVIMLVYALNYSYLITGAYLGDGGLAAAGGDLAAGDGVPDLVGDGGGLVLVSGV